MYTSQTITGLASGTYTVSARVVSGGGQKCVFLGVKGYGSGTTELKASIPGLGWPNWTRVTIESIPVTNGQLTIGFYSFANAGNWMSVDDVRLSLNQ